MKAAPHSVYFECAVYMHACIFMCYANKVYLYLREREGVNVEAKYKTIHQYLHVLSYAAWAVVSHIFSINNVHRSVPQREGKEKIY